MEDDIDTSPGGEYYTSSNSPTSSSRNWTEDMEGGKCGAAPPWGCRGAQRVGGALQGLWCSYRAPSDSEGAVCWCSAMGPLGQDCCQPPVGT